FSATVGDYNSIIGNTGGDNRAEFDTRFSHAIWYESPKFGAFRVNAFWSPGQNRSTDNINPASGEPDCTGGNQPPCNDGSIGDVYSVAGIFDSGPLYLIGAYEMHKDVNRTGDEAAIGVRDEFAYKVGIQYKLPTRTTLSGIYERMVRNDNDDNFNERKRTSYFFSLVQKFSPMDDFTLSWAHANKTPGDPEFG